jgi:hypothetical protein
MAPLEGHFARALTDRMAQRTIAAFDLRNDTTGRKLIPEASGMKAVEARQYRITGGVAAWPIPVVSTILGLAAFGLDALELALTIALVGFLAQTFWLGGVVEVSPVGLTRGFLLNGRFLGRTTVIPWEAIASVHTEWRGPADDTALVTIVRDGAGRSIRLSTAMGLSSYWACLAAIVRAAPRATRSGLTDAILKEGPPGRRSLISAAATAGALALVVVAVVGVHYLWAQGQSSFARSQEPSGPALEITGHAAARR